MASRLRHRQTKGTATVKADLRSPRHISTPPKRYELVKHKASIVIKALYYEQF